MRSRALLGVLYPALALACSSSGSSAGSLDAGACADYRQAICDHAARDPSVASTDELCLSPPPDYVKACQLLKDACGHVPSPLCAGP